jgi:hypothetical protein
LARLPTRCCDIEYAKKGGHGGNMVSPVLFVIMAHR